MKKHWWRRPAAALHRLENVEVMARGLPRRRLSESVDDGTVRTVGRSRTSRQYSTWSAC